MPFTFSHPIAVFPLTFLPQKWVSLTGLIIGSTIPDFEYFIRMKINSQYSHTIDGIFWFDLPLAILIAFIFHNIVRDSLYSNLPLFFQKRLTGFKDFKWNSYFRQNWLIMITSTLTGILTHLLWDNFTHETGYFVERISLMKDNVDISSFSIPVFKILQHGSTLIGGAILIFVILRLPESDKKPQKINYLYWLTFIIIIGIVLGIRFLTGLDYNYTDW